MTIKVEVHPLCVAASFHTAQQGAVEVPSRLKIVDRKG